ncbi:hypothetical protein GCM10023340_42070 [Nocardioides marinquilinus]|uniref:WXG100 family type VII secretion target n=1 Tax=Nocardioides marinquilinus TaxID=1210400 RepID=A0ABP9Q8U1_9ACTN
MSGEFSVKPKVVRAAGTDMLTMADAILLAKQCAGHIQVDSGGTFLNDIAASANDVREQLETDYASTGKAYTTFDNAGNALRGMAQDYADTDADQAAKFDKIMDTDTVTAPEYMGGEPGIHAEDFSSVTTVEDAFEDYNSLHQFTNDVEYVIGLDWVSSWLTTAGIVDPFAGFRDDLEGDWTKLGKVLGAMRNLVTFWETAKSSIESVPVTFVANWVDTGNGYPFLQYNSEYNGAPNWSGNACDATVEWMTKAAEAAGDHGYAIQLKADALTGRLVAMYEGMDLVLDAVQDLLEIMPWGQSFDDFIKDLVLPWRVADRLIKIAGAAAKTLTRIRALIVLVVEVVGWFSELLYAVADLEFPDVSYSPPDVDGP